ncbi:MAG: sulfotransferase [Phycisphaerae bacterium]
MKRRFVYIISPSYSGSTLLTFLLARHPDIATIGELKATAMGDVDRYRCSCGENIRACPFWQALAEKLHERGTPFDLTNFGTHYRDFSNPLIDRLLRLRVHGSTVERLRDTLLNAIPGAKHHIAAIHKKNRAIVEATCEIQGRPIFLDGSKEPNRLRYLRAAGFDDVRVIHLIRDGRAVTNSALGHEYDSLEVAATDWRDTHAEAVRIRAASKPGEFFTLKYEELCAQPREKVTEICNFLGIDPAGLDWNAPTNAFHILGNSMRNRPLENIRLDERWKTSLNENHLRRFDRLAGAMNREFGYG